MSVAPSRRLAALAALAAVVAGLLAAGPAAAQPTRKPADVKPEARRHFERGAALFKERKWAEAVVEYQQAYALAPRPVLLFNIARAYHEAGALDEARDYYARFLAEAPEGAAGAEAREFAADVDRRIAARTAPPPPAGEPPPPAGEEAVTAAAPAPARRRFHVGAMASFTIGDIDYEDVADDRMAGGVDLFAFMEVARRVAVQVDLGYQPKGEQSESETFHIDFLQLTVRGRVALGPVFLAAGPFFGIRVADDTEYDDVTTSDYGVAAGLGASYPLGPGALVGEVRYEHGLAAVRPGYEAYTRTIALALGYAY